MTMLPYCLAAILGIVLSSWLPVGNAGTPAPEQFFQHQRVDHVDPTSAFSNETFTQRYYIWEKEFQGPGSPIFLILGGEGAISPKTGIFYPFVSHHLAKIFGGYVLQPEHRFYGKSQPLKNHTMVDVQVSQDARVILFTPEQALHDAIRLVQSVKETLGCSHDKFSKLYCPVITVGGSYPGWLSAMARVVFPHEIDMAYSASAPMTFYSQQVNEYSGQYDYYDLITRVAEQTLPGCAEGVRSALREAGEDILNGHFLERSFGICQGSTPAYIEPHDVQLLKDELMMVVGYSFANANMGNYPPSNTTSLYSACKIFTNTYTGSVTRLRQFLVEQLPPQGTDCWNFTAQLPTGRHASVSAGDWSGVGTGTDGESWDFQTCTLLVEAIGFSSDSMFPPRDWSFEWLQRHCQVRFGVVPSPYQLVNRWNFDNLVGNNVTRIVFTNGLRDGWSVGGIQQNLSDTLIALNFPNGAHHSDLSGRGPSENDTDDIKQGFRTITRILGEWLEDVRQGSTGK